MMATQTLTRPPFAHLIRTARRAAEISGETLAACSGVHFSYIGLIECGRRVPRLEIALKLATCLGIPEAKAKRAWKKSKALKVTR